jgi:hypothetical protein
VPRTLAPDADVALPLHVQTPGARIRKSGETLLVETEDSRTEIALGDISDLVLWGPVTMTTPALHALMSRDTPVSWLSTGGWLLGHTTGTGTKAVDVRIAQHAAAAEPAHALRIARALVAAKIRNQRTLLRRNWKAAREALGLAQRAAVVATALLRNLRLLKPKMTKESTMTETTIDLPAVIAKSDDADFLRELIQDAAQRLMDIEVAAVCGEGHGERSPDRENQRNGCRPRQ